jgi:hypothetical protein
MLPRLGITPSPEQMEVLLYPGRLALVVGGERGGKSFVSALYGTTRTPFGKLFWIIGSTYELARAEFGYWVEFLATLDAIDTKRDVSLPKIGQAQAITRSGQRIVTKTSDDVRKIAMEAPDGIILAEAAQHSYETFLKCLGRTSETRGWVLCSGTLEGSVGWYPELFQDWQNPLNSDGGRSFSLPTWSNLAIFPGGREDPEILRLERLYSSVEGMFEERCGAVPVPSVLLVFRSFRNTVHVNSNIVFNPDLPVYLAIDPSSGGDPYAVLAVQFYDRPGDIDKIDDAYIIDEYYERGLQAEDIIDLLKTRPWWKSVRGGAIDVEDPDEQKRWQKYGKVHLVSKKVEQFAGIRRLQSFLHYKRDEKQNLVKKPHLYINPKCKGIIYEFSHYKRKLAEARMDISTGHIVEKPPQNQDDHAVKGLWYLLIARYGDVKGAHKAEVVKTWLRKKL